MIHPERGKLIPVTGNQNTPDLENAVDVQFNPSNLKVSLSNTLKENQRNGNTRAAQYVDKSSSSLSVELIFDTTFADEDTEQVYQQRARNEGREREAITAGSDVRLLTRKIADAFIKPIASGNRLKAPKRCLFQWGAFEFLGLVESFEETLDFFSREGTPLRATVSLKLKEDRYQFRNRDAEAAEQETPTLTATGNAAGDEGEAEESESPESGGAALGNDGGEPAPSQDSMPVPGGSDDQPGNWRDNALFNGVENPRLPTAPTLANPRRSPAAALGLDPNLGGGVKTAIDAASASPAFRFGNSASLGTRIEGAFGASLSGHSSSGLSAEGLLSGSQQLRAEEGLRIHERLPARVPRPPDPGVGFD